MAPSVNLKPRISWFSVSGISHIRPQDLVQFLGCVQGSVVTACIVYYPAYTCCGLLKVTITSTGFLDGKNGIPERSSSIILRGGVGCGKSTKLVLCGSGSSFIHPNRKSEKMLEERQHSTFLAEMTSDFNLEQWDEIPQGWKIAEQATK